MMDTNNDQDVSAADLAEMQEFANTNGKSCIEWDYWVSKRPMLTAAQAVRLMSGLDPELFSGSLALEKGEKAGTSKIHASRLQSLATSYGMEKAAPMAWLAWADSINEHVHYGFRAAVDRTFRDTPFNAGGVAGEKPNDILSTPGGVAIESANSAPEVTNIESDHKDESAQPSRAEALFEQGRSGATKTHRIKTRNRQLDTEIKLAWAKAANPDDSQSIWDALCAMADKPETSKLLGLDEGGVKYRADNGDVAWLTKRAFMERLRRRNKSSR